MIKRNFNLAYKGKYPYYKINRITSPYNCCSQDRFFVRRLIYRSRFSKKFIRYRASDTEKKDLLTIRFCKVRKNFYVYVTVKGVNLQMASAGQINENRKYRRSKLTKRELSESLMKTMRFLIPKIIASEKRKKRRLLSQKFKKKILALKLLKHRISLLRKDYSYQRIVKKKKAKQDLARYEYLKEKYPDEHAVFEKYKKGKFYSLKLFSYIGFDFVNYSPHEPFWKDIIKIVFKYRNYIRYLQNQIKKKNKIKKYKARFNRWNKKKKKLFRPFVLSKKRRFFLKSMLKLHLKKKISKRKFVNLTNFRSIEDLKKAVKQKQPKEIKYKSLNLSHVKLRFRTFRKISHNGLRKAKPRRK